MGKSFRKPIIIMTAAFGITVLATVNTTFAQVGFGKAVVLPDATTPVSILIDPPTAITDQTGIVELGTGAAADSGEMALVSLAARQVQLAKSSAGAKQVAAALNATTYKWGARQMSCLSSLWNRESHWNFQAHNYYSGATGIAQAMPADKMDVVATDWRTNPVTQIKWGLRYIKIRYGTPCKALARSHWSGYY
jgi:hypothetical protein